MALMASGGDYYRYSSDVDEASSKAPQSMTGFACVPLGVGFVSAGSAGISVAVTCADIGAIAASKSAAFGASVSVISIS
jgi:hypothetical protein